MNNQSTFIYKLKYVLLSIFILLISEYCFSQSGWIQQNSGITSDLNSVKFTSPITGWCVGDSGVIMRTTNAGINWTAKPLSDSVNLNSIFFTSPITGYITGNSGLLLKTTDAGLNWVDKSFITSDLSALFFVNGLTGYVGGPELSDIYKTTDGGNSWNPVFIGLNVKSIYFPTEVTGFLSTQYLSGDAIFKTTNSGVDWLEVFFIARLDKIESLFFIDSLHGWAASPNTRFLLIPKIYRTTNSGLKWSESTHYTNVVSYSLYFVDLNTGWAAGNRGTIFRTSNSGLTWTQQTPEILGRAYRSIYFVDTVTGWCVGDSGKILKTSNGGVITGFSNTSSEIPDEYFLSQNYPNPFNPVTKIKFSIPQISNEGLNVNLVIFDITGKEIIRLINNKYYLPGIYEIEFKSKDISSGVYFYKLESQEKYLFTQVKRMVILK